MPDYEENTRRGLEANSGRTLEEARVQGWVKPDPGTKSEEAE